MAAAVKGRPVAEVRDAWEQLQWLACQMRSDWDAEDSWAALWACQTANWPFEKAAREVWRLIWDPDGTPAELLFAARDTRPQPRRGPEAYQRGHHLWRDALGIPEEDPAEDGDAEPEPAGGDP